ncbi:hypothetical protein QBC40DRAFT_163293, partial [Triangularia verruculosa]
NGAAERLGGDIKRRVTVLKVLAKLLEFLWPKIIRVAIYLNNFTPKVRLG